MPITISRYVLPILASTLCSQASAQFVTPDGYGWTRGTANTVWGEWDDFSSASGPNTPDVGTFPAPLPAGWQELAATCITPSAFLTSTGNIYSFSEPIEFEIVVPSYDVSGSTTAILLQTRTLGSQVDPKTVTCNELPPVEVVETMRVDVGQGFLVQTLWRFEVSASSSHLIEFGAIASSMSLDGLAVDTYTTQAACLADVNGDGSVTPTDFSAWVAAFNNNLPGCDQNGDGACSPTDFSAWITNYNNGCP